MGVSSTTNTVIANGDGVTTAFPFSYYFFAQADLYVYTYTVLTGAIALKTIATHYTISGTQNAQGLYPNGGNVNFLAAPANTVKVIVSRYPILTNTYALLQNGNISSIALTQQLDYLTLLMQSMQDQINHATSLPPGFAATFNPDLPSTVALIANAGKTLILNATADGLDLGPTGGDVADAVQAAADALASELAAAASATAAAVSAAAAAASATAAAGSATAAAASATAAAVSAAAAAASLGYIVENSHASPYAVVAGTTIPFVAGTRRVKKYIQGSGGAVTLTASPRIQAGTIDGQEFMLIGCSDTNTVSIDTGNGTQKNGVDVMLDGSATIYNWDAGQSLWVEVSRNNI